MQFIVSIRVTKLTYEHQQQVVLVMVGEYPDADQIAA
jgi:hypothetical protein